MNIPDELKTELTFESYPSYPARPTLETLMGWTEADALTYEAQCADVDREVNRVRRQHLACESAWATFLEASGWKVRRPGRQGWTADFTRQMKAMRPMGTPASPLNCYQPVLSGSSGNITQQGKTFRWAMSHSPSTLWERIGEARRLIDREQAKDHFVQVAIDRAPKHGIRASDYSDLQAFARAVNAAEHDAAMLAKYPVGTEMDVDDNICECRSWTVGESRCSCGERRMCMDSEGDMVSGFYFWPSDC